jgi:hypothetical protein
MTKKAVQKLKDNANSIIVSTVAGIAVGAGVAGLFYDQICHAATMFDAPEVPNTALGYPEHIVTGWNKAADFGDNVGKTAVGVAAVIGFFLANRLITYIHDREGIQPQETGSSTDASLSSCDRLTGPA